MRQGSPTASLTGQKPEDSWGLGQSNGGALTIFNFSGVRRVGALQEPARGETAEVAPERGQTERPIPIGVTLLPSVNVPRRGPEPALQTRQLWEGTVTQVRDGDFVAVLSDRTRTGNPDEQVAFDFDEVSPADRGLVGLGSTFYWIIGSERTVGGQVKNVSILQFRRVPTWTQSALTKARDRAKRVLDLFRTQE